MCCRPGRRDRHGRSVDAVVVAESCCQDHADRASPLIIRPRLGRTFQGMVSIIGRMSVIALNASVSSESIGVQRAALDCSPIRDQQQRRYFNQFGSAENDQLSATAKPPIAALIALELVTVARITRAPPNLPSALATSCVLLST